MNVVYQFTNCFVKIVFAFNSIGEWCIEFFSTIFVEKILASCQLSPFFLAKSSK